MKTACAAFFLICTLHAQVATYAVSQAGFADTLAKAAADLHVPIGIEWIRTPQTLAHFSRSWQNATPRMILQDIVAAFPDYILQFPEGAPAVVRHKPLLADPHDVLNVRLDSYQVQRETPQLFSTQLSCRLIGIVNGNEVQGCFLSVSENIGAPRITFSLTKPSVLDILNRALTEYARGVWILTYTPDLPQTPAGYYRTIEGNERSQGKKDYFPSWQFRL